MRHILLAIGIVSAAYAPAYAQWGTTNDLAARGIAIDTSSIHKSDEHAYFTILFLPHQPWMVRGRPTLYEIEKKDLDCLIDKIETLGAVLYGEDGPLETEAVPKIFWPLSKDMQLVRRAVCASGTSWTMLPGHPNDVAHGLRARSRGPVR